MKTEEGVSDTTQWGKSQWQSNDYRIMSSHIKKKKNQNYNQRQKVHTD